jgi:guanylate kinase
MRIIIVGKSASGKDFLKNRLKNKNNLFHSISTTTRPRRDGELNNVDYRFVDDIHFKRMISDNEFFEWNCFNGWYYGTELKQWKTKDVFIMTPSGIAKIPLKDRLESFVIYLDISNEVRAERLVKRGLTGDDSGRRMAADEIDFKDFKDYDIRITNPDF